MFRLINSSRQAIKRPRVKYFLGAVAIIIAMSVISLVPLSATPPRSSSTAVQAKPAHKTIASGEVKSAVTEQPQPSSPDVYAATSVYRQPATQTAVHQTAQPVTQQPVQPPPADDTQPVQPPTKTICKPMAESASTNICVPNCGAGRMCPYCSGTDQDYSCVLIDQTDNSSSI